MEYVVKQTTVILTTFDLDGYETTIRISALTIESQYSVQQIQDWSDYLRTVANRLNEPDNKLAEHFYNVHYAIGPVGMVESDKFALDEEYLALVAEQDGIPLEEALCRLIESLAVITYEGGRLGPEFMDQSVWNSGLRDYLDELLAELIRKHF